MNNDRLLKNVSFSDAFEGKRKPGRPLLSWRQAIAQDIKKFNLQHILMSDNYPQNSRRGQYQLEQIFWTIDKQQKDVMRSQKNKILFWDSKWFSFEIRVLL